MNFSVLMSIYHKEKPHNFDRCMQSIWEEQTVKPDEIILVEDGPLTEELYAVVNRWEEKLCGAFRTIPLEKNVGLGDALNIGLQECQSEIVARMDTDDIANPQRFEKQLKIFEDNKMDMCSSWVSEFDDDENKIISHRKLPEIHDAIVEFAKKRNPFNHPAVMYKKSAVELVGGYQKMMWFEDYYLWVRMIMNGSKLCNIQEALVKMRAGYGQLERRSGWRYALNELLFQRELLRMGFINGREFVRNVMIRLMIRVAPKSIVKIVYKRLRDV